MSYPYTWVDILMCWIAVLFLVLIESLFAAIPAWATPLLAIREADNCAGCHRPGRSQRPVLWRRCTLDCQGCHVDPNGAGPRNQWGYYYSHDQLAMINILKPEDPLEDRSYFDLHYDGRIIARETVDGQRVTPMNAEVSVRLRPLIRWLHLVYQASFMGRLGQPGYQLDRDKRRLLEKGSIMVDALPLNTYIRAARTTPVYGVRRPNHTAWIREQIGLDQFSLSDQLIVGGTPNVPFFHVALLQGDHRLEEEDKQKGVSSHFGMRGVSFGWFLYGSYWQTSSEKAAVNMQSLGVGAKPLEIAFSWERNWRNIEEKVVLPAQSSQWQSQALKIHPSSVIDEVSLAWVGFRGIQGGVQYETLRQPNRSSQRYSLFLDLHPVPFLQFEVWQRFEKGDRDLKDLIAIAHFYWDF